MEQRERDFHQDVFDTRKQKTRIYCFKNMDFKWCL